MALNQKIKLKPFDRHKYQKVLKLIQAKKLNTVCLEANCPNRYECFSSSTVTFMILGKICTRNCQYCNVKTGQPKKINPKEPGQIAEAIKTLGIKYAVITCVSRDDLADCGANHFIKTVQEIKKLNPNCQIELLISDLGGNWLDLKKIIEKNPNVLNHNLETVKQLFPKLRPQGNYTLSLRLLKESKKINPKIITKSGLMVGLGETKSQLIKTFQDLKSVNCDILTVGQYLQPSPKYVPIKKYYNQKEFQELKELAKKEGIKKIVAGSLVRSSYKAKENLCQLADY